MSNQRFVLNTGSEIPALGLDTVYSHVGDLETAIANNYRHFHILSGQANEDSSGRAIDHAIKTGKLQRSNTFITITIPCTPSTNVEAALDRALAALGLDHVDLCLMKWEGITSPSGKSHIGVYEDLENLKRRWKTRAVGISGYSVESLQELIPRVSMKPAVNHFDVSLSENQVTLVDYCNWNGVLALASTAGDMGAGRTKDAPLVEELSRKHHTTPENIIFNWNTSSRRAVLVDSPLVQQFSRVDLARCDVYQLDGLSQQNTDSASYHRSPSVVELGCNGRVGDGFRGPNTAARQVLPVL